MKNLLAIEWYKNWNSTEKLAIKWRDDWHFSHDSIKFSDYSSQIIFDDDETQSSSVFYPLSQLSLLSDEEEIIDQQSCKTNSIVEKSLMKRDLSAYSVCNETKKTKSNESDYDEFIEEIMNSYDQF